MESAGDDQVSISKKSLLLKPEEANLSDLFHFLISGEIQSKESTECLQEKETNLKRRFIIFISLAVQKSLQTMSTPLQLSGSIAEFCLNFISNNSELLPLLRGKKERKKKKEKKNPLKFDPLCVDFETKMFKFYAIFTGNLTVPARDSALFVSAVGHVDRRVDLDENIKPGDNKYLGMLSAMSSKLSYENRAFIKKIVEDQWKVTGKILRLHPFPIKLQYKNLN